MRNGSQDRFSKVAWWVLEYLLNHPQAGDSVAGIWGWWLKGKDPRPLSEDVQSALTELIRVGLVEALVGPGGTTTYQMKASEHERIQKMLESRETRDRRDA